MGHIIDLENRLASAGKAAQLVQHVEDANMSKALEQQFYVAQQKHDGVWAAIVRDEASQRVVIFSRTGKRFNIPNALATALYHDKYMRRFPANWVCIAELCCSNLSLEQWSGLLSPNRVKQWTSEQVGTVQLGINIQVHDNLPIDTWVNGGTELTYKQRWVMPLVSFDDSTYYHKVLNKFIGELVWVQFGSAPLEYGLKQGELIVPFKSILAETTKDGGEGYVLKALDADYVIGRRSYHVMKEVRGIDVDLVCTAVKFGKGKRTDLIAALQFEYKGKVFWADLGKGWDDNSRAGLTEAYNIGCSLRSPVGKTFHVHGLQESSKGVIRLPKVMEMRIDK